jgi:hypothetical protein
MNHWILLDHTMKCFPSILFYLSENALSHKIVSNGLIAFCNFSCLSVVFPFLDKLKTVAQEIGYAIRYSCCASWRASIFSPFHSNVLFLLLLFFEIMFTHFNKQQEMMEFGLCKTWFWIKREKFHEFSFDAGPFDCLLLFCNSKLRLELQNNENSLNKCSNCTSK